MCSFKMPPLPTISIPPYFPNCVFIAKPEPDRSSGTDFESPAGEAFWSGHYVICADGGFRKIPLSSLTNRTYTQNYA